MHVVSHDCHFLLSMIKACPVLAYREQNLNFHQMNSGWAGGCELIKFFFFMKKVYTSNISSFW